MYLAIMMVLGVLALVSGAFRGHLEIYIATAWLITYLEFKDRRHGN